MASETLVGKINSLPPEQLARVEGFVDSLVAESKRKARAEAIAEYAARHAGTDSDLDPVVEAAAIEFMLRQEAE